MMIRYNNGKKAANEKPRKDAGKTMKKYKTSCQSDFWQAIFEKEASYLAIRLRGCKKILSVGCGPAIIEKKLQERGFDITGLDVSNEALEGASDSIRTVVGSAEAMDFESNSFDAAIYVASLQFVDNYKKAFQEAKRVLKPDGKVIVLLLNPSSEFFKKKTKQVDSYVNKIKHPSLAPIENSMREHFDQIKTRYFLGASGNEVFESRNPNLAVVYILEGTKP